jgi:hypothetical protein
MRRIFLAADELVNTILDGEPGDSISHRAAVAATENKRWGCILCRIIEIFEKNHCTKSIAAHDAQVKMEADSIVKK